MVLGWVQKCKYILSKNFVSPSNVRASPEMAPHIAAETAWIVPRMAWRKYWKTTNTDCRAAPIVWTMEVTRDVSEPIIVDMVELTCACFAGIVFVSFKSLVSVF
jgi:hypothetical protein